MNNTLSFITVLAAGSIMLAACDKHTGEIPDVPNEYAPLVLTRAESEIAGRANEFGFDVYRALYEDGQMLISPLSLSLALSMTACGSDGETERQMMSTLGFDGYSAEDVAGYYRKMVSALEGMDKLTAFEVANSVWLSNNLDVNKEFISTVRDNYASEERTVDFLDPEVVDLINGWCYDNTHGKIDRIVKDIPKQTIMALVNALYFNGKWGGFEFEEKTVKEIFRTVGGSKSKVDMMSASSLFGYVSYEGWSMVTLPYGNGAFSMSVILPPEDVRFRDAAQTLDADMFKRLSVQTGLRQVNLKMPAFKYEYSVDEQLKDALSALGMPCAFNAERADFSKVGRCRTIDNYNIFIGTVKHKTFIDVNARGTEAAAVTYVGMEIATSLPASEPGIIEFTADRPFFYVISEKSSGSVIFIGQKTD